jgi:hypothetical protein
MAELVERGVGLVVLKQQIDTTTPTGRLVFHVLAAIDEFQRELIVEGTLEGLDAARARGRTGGRPPAMTPDQVALARKLAEEKDEHGRNAYTVTRIAEMLCGSCNTREAHSTLPEFTRYRARPPAAILGLTLFYAEPSSLAGIWGSREAADEAVRRWMDEHDPDLQE